MFLIITAYWADFGPRTEDPVLLARVILTLTVLGYVIIYPWQFIGLWRSANFYIKDKFYSDKNKLHIFKILQKHIKENFNVNITIKNDVDSFYENIDTIFNEKNNTDELTDLNKKLIDKSYNSYLITYNLNDLKYINSGNRISGTRYEYLYKIDRDSWYEIK